MGIMRAVRHLRRNAIRAVATGGSAMVTTLYTDTVVNEVFNTSITTSVEHAVISGASAALAVFVPVVREVLDDFAEDGDYDGPEVLDGDNSVDELPDFS